MARAETTNSGTDEFEGATFVRAGLRIGTGESVDGGDWRPSVGDGIREDLEKEWAHLRYIRRDRARMRSRQKR